MELEQPQTLLNRQIVNYLNGKLIGLFLVLAILFLAVYQETVAYLLHDWMQIQHGEYAHGFAVLAVAAFMVWGIRATLQHTVIRPTLWALLPVSAFSLTWMIGILLGIRIVESLSFFLLIPSIILALSGRQFVMRLWFPIAFLLVAFPVWELFLPYLQSLAATISHLLLQVSGTPIIREDAYLIVPAGKFLVAEGCSGLRYLLASMTFAGFYIYLEQLTRWRAACFFVIAVAAAILANSLRITAVIIAGNLTEMQHPWVHDHLMLGWYIFAAMLLPIFWIGNRFADAEELNKKKVRVQKGQVFSESTTKFTQIVPMLIVALLVGPLLKGVLQTRAASAKEITAQLSAPDAKDGWVSHSTFVQDGVHTLVPNYTGADTTLDQLYKNDEKFARLYVATYFYQAQDKELINVHNFLFDEERWQAVSKELVNPNNGSHPLVEVVLKNTSGDERLMWYWYRTAGQVTTKPIISKLYDLYGMIMGNSTSSVIMLVTNSAEGVGKGRLELQSFYNSIAENINREIDTVN